MNVLLIGDANSIYIKSLCEFVFMPMNAEIGIIMDNRTMCDEYKDFYSDNKVEVFTFDNSSVLRKIPYVRSTLGVKLWVKDILKHNGNPDYIDIHGLNRFRCSVGLELEKLSGAKLISSVWGSDLYRSSQTLLKEFEKCFDKSVYITAENIKMQQLINEKYKSAYSDKIRILRFGDYIFNRIDNLEAKEQKSESRERLGIKTEDSLIITLAHNASPAQQHEKILEVIAKLPEEKQKKLTVLLPMTYGRRADFDYSAVEELANSLSCETVIFKDFMREEDVARIRFVTDIFIHAQLSDAFSCAVQENLYSGAVVLNGSWLKYKELEDYNIKLFTFNDFEDLSTLLNDVLNHFEKYQRLSSNNRDGLQKLSSWEENAKEWVKLFI